MSEHPDDAFERLYLDEFVRAARLAHLLTGSNAAAEDLAQEAFLRVQPKLGSIERPNAYLTATVVNLCHNWQRSRGRQIRRELGAAPVQVTEDAEHGELLELVDGLPFRQRTVLVARYWLGLSEAEIADLLHCPAGTVKSLASRALASLRKELR